MGSLFGFLGMILKNLNALDFTHSTFKPRVIPTYRPCWVFFLSGEAVELVVNSNLDLTLVLVNHLNIAFFAKTSAKYASICRPAIAPIWLRVNRGAVRQTASLRRPSLQMGRILVM